MMASIVERTAEGIIYKSANSIDVPDVDLTTLLFESEACRVPGDTIIHADADEPSNHLTKASLIQQSRKVAHVLRTQYGIGAGGPNQDAVSMISTGHFMIPLIFHGTIIADGIFAPTSASATAGEYTYQLQATGARLIICAPDTKDVALAAARNVGLGPRNVLLFGGTGALELREAASGAPVPIPNQELDWQRSTDRAALARHTICVLFSSGTTGLPKALGLSQGNMVAACTLTLAGRARRRRPVMLAHLPTAHVAGALAYLVNACYLAATCYWMPRFDFALLCAHARRHRVSSLFTVPPVWLLVAKSPLARGCFDHCAEAVSGAAPMGERLQAEAGRKLGRGRTRVRQTWGLSETCGSITIVPIDQADAAPAGSVGSLLPNCSARVVDEEERDVAPGSRGEVWVRGPVVTRGYWRDDEANRHAFRPGGWFRTGDVGVFRHGWLFIVDRKKELIKYKGNQVAPAELEAVLLAHPQILDAAVIGVPGEGTEVPRAYVVVADRTRNTAEDIARWFDGQGLARYKKLRGGVVFVDAIPKTASGKILRKTLRDMAKEEVGLSPKL
ncbi:AMP-binding enzyme [Biscogniauxia sp. FL1348]|nr:AMP-binding enzyme [Biscogniauxia sp. FL1348]